MSHLHRVGCVLRVVAGVAATGVLIAACTASEPPMAGGDEATSEAAQAQTSILIDCTNAGGTVAGALRVMFTPQGTYCYRTSAISSGGAPPPPPAPGLPSCWQLARQLGCIGFGAEVGGAP